MRVRTVLRECAADLLDTEGRPTVERIVNCAYMRDGAAFAEAADEMVRTAAREIVAKMMRDLTEDSSDQLAFAGFGGLPTAIAVPTPEGTYYVRSDRATWDELVIGRNVRAENVEAAQAKLHAYDETIEGLRPYMEGRPNVTVADAVAAMQKAAA